MELSYYDMCIEAGLHEKPLTFVKLIQPDDSYYYICRFCGFIDTTRMGGKL